MYIPKTSHANDFLALRRRTQLTSDPENEINIYPDSARCTSLMPTDVSTGGYRKLLFERHERSC